MSTSRPSAEPLPLGTSTPSSPHPNFPQTLHIAFWGTGAEALASEFNAHALMQTGWVERLRITAHEMPHADDSHAMRDWLAAELKPNRTLPHLNLLAPSNSPRDAIASELRLRDALIDAGIGFQVLYGTSASERIHNAANAVALTAKAVLPSSERACFVINDIANPGHPRMRSWNCEKCSDPECEHKLFTGLLSA